MNKSVFIIPMLLLGCGSDNKSDAPNDTKDTYYSLEKVTSLAKGILYSSELIATEDPKYGFISIENQAETVINGVMVTPQYRRFTMTESRFGSGNISAPVWVSTFYIDTSTKNLISFSTFASRSGIGSRINCTSSSPYHFPAQVKSGDSDSTPGFSCDNNVRIAPGNWRAESTTNGNLNFVVQTETVDISGEIIKETLTYTLNTQGTIVSFQINKLKSVSN